MLLDNLSASLLGNLLTCKSTIDWIVRASAGKTRVGECILGAG